MAALMKHARDLRVHARLDRPGRGRADAPADRAGVEPAPDPQHGSLASVRHGRDRGGLGAALERSNGPTRAAAVAPEPARLSRRDAAALESVPRGGYVLSEGAGGAAGGAHRHRLGSRSWRSRRRSSSPPRASPRAWCRCPRPPCSTGRTRRTRRRAAARRAARGGRGGRDRLSGASTSGSRAPWSASTVSASRRRRRSCSSISA